MLCARWKGNGFGTPARWSVDFDDAHGSLSSPSVFATLTSVDLDQDGQSDVCMRQSSGLYCALRRNQEHFEAAGLATAAFSDEAGFSDEVKALTISMVDLNGDRRPDVCGRNAAGLLCALGIGDGTFGPEKLWDDGTLFDPTTPAPIAQPLWGDLDGDGRKDVCTRTQRGLVCARAGDHRLETPSLWSASMGSDGSSHAPSDFFSALELVDVDGDRRSDVCGYSTGSVQCALSRGGDFASPAKWAELSLSLLDVRPETLRFGDLNGDGRADLCLLDTDGLYCAIASTGRFGPLTVWEQATFNDGHGFGRRTAAASLTLVDLNRDGRADVCARNDEGLWCAYSDGQHFVDPALSVRELSLGAWRSRPSGGELVIGERRSDVRWPSGRIAAENELPGATNWWVPYPQWAMDDEIAAYTDELSYPTGAAVSVMVSTKNNHDPIAWHLYRTGYYGGLGAREIASGTAEGNRHAPEAISDSRHHPAHASWPVTFSVAIPADAVSGIYLLRLDSQKTKRSFLDTFVVREDNRRADLVLQRSDFTDIAYNNWDGGLNRSSQYNGNVWASIDRPMRSAFIQGDNWGYTAGFFVYEYSLIRFVERQGYDVTYVSNWDVHTRSDALTRGRAFLSAGHDEYWSPEMRDRVENARDAGMHLAFFGSDDVDGRIRFHATDRHAFSRTVSDSNISKFEYARQSYDRGKPPRDNPQDALTGTHYADWCYVAHPDCLHKNGPGQPFARLSQADDYVLSDEAHPIFRTVRGSGVRVPHIVGYEYEALYAQPANLPFSLHVLGRAPEVPIEGGPPVMVAYQTQAGARVFNAGSMHWNHGLDGWVGRAAFRLKGAGRRCSSTDSDCFVHVHPMVQQLTRNILADFSARPETPSPDLYDPGEACDWNNPAARCMR